MLGIFKERRLSMREGTLLTSCRGGVRLRETRASDMRGKYLAEKKGFNSFL